MDMKAILEKNLVKTYKDAGHVGATFLTLPIALGVDAYVMSMNVEASDAAILAYGSVIDLCAEIPDEHREHIAHVVQHCIGRKTAEEERRKDKQDRIDAERMITYKVRGMSPLEHREFSAILRSVRPPRVPTIKQPVAPASGKLDARTIQMETVENVNDPTYQQELLLFEDQLLQVEQQSIMYSLMTCVDGFNLSDDEISEALSQDAHLRVPLEELRKRLDQLTQIILKDMDMRHVLAIQLRINELTGRRPDDVNFI